MGPTTGPILAADPGEDNCILGWDDPAARAVTFAAIRTSAADPVREHARRPVAAVGFDAGSLVGRVPEKRSAGWTGRMNVGY